MQTRALPLGTPAHLVKLSTHSVKTIGLRIYGIRPLRSERARERRTNLGNPKVVSSPLSVLRSPKLVSPFNRVLLKMVLDPPALPFAFAPPPVGVAVPAVVVAPAAGAGAAAGAFPPPLGAVPAGGPPPGPGAAAVPAAAAAVPPAPPPRRPSRPAGPREGVRPPSCRLWPPGWHAEWGDGRPK